MKFQVRERSPWGTPGDIVDIDETPLVQWHEQRGVLLRLEEEAPQQEPVDDEDDDPEE